MASACHTWAEAVTQYIMHADFGDKPWVGELPAPVLKEIKEAKGKVHAIGSSPWWCVILLCAPDVPCAEALGVQPLEHQSAGEIPCQIGPQQCVWPCPATPSMPCCSDRGRHLPQGL